MNELIKNTYPDDSAERKEIGKGQYSLVIDGEIIPQKSWGNFVRPGLNISLRLWENSNDVIKFKDSVGSIYNCPWSFVKTWTVSHAPRPCLWICTLQYAVLNASKTRTGHGRFDQTSLRSRRGYRTSRPRRPLRSYRDRGRLDHTTRPMGEVHRARHGSPHENVARREAPTAMAKDDGRTSPWFATWRSFATWCWFAKWPSFATWSIKSSTAAGP